MPSTDELPTRRDFLAAAGAVTASALLPTGLGASADLPADSPSGSSILGRWVDDDFGLPAYHYTGPLRFPNSPRYENEPMLPDDPFFLTGNYRLTLFTHASGALQMLTGERAWGRMNQGDARFSGAYQATVEIDGEKHSLVGLDEPAALAATKRFGVGFARYDYTLAPSLAITRRISVLPSMKAGEGTSACLVEILLRNTWRPGLQDSLRRGHPAAL